jgi:SAM-dependent methyltransferase
VDLAELPAATFRRHPWEVARFAFYASVLEDAGLLRARCTVLDAGAGDAFFVRRLLEKLPHGSRAVAWDAGYDAATVAALAREAPPSLELTADEPPGDFDLTLLLDVLEHVPDDAGFLAARVRSCVRGGHVLLAVPAWQALFTAHDTGLGHLRRYRPSAGAALARGAGLEVLRSGGAFHTLLLPRALARTKEALLGAEPPSAPPELAWRGGRVLTAAVETALRLDNALSRRLARAGVELPGLSWWALCRKP